MSEYFKTEQGIAYQTGCEAGPVLGAIANRFVADHPPVPVQYYMRSRNNFSISEDYLEEIKLHERFLQMKTEQYAYAWAQLTPPQGGPFHFRFSAYGPVRIFVNGVCMFRTNHVQERFCEEISDICLDLEEGRNSLVFECMSTPLGCGFRIGSSSYKGRRIQFFAPSKEHNGMSGMIFSGPMKEAMATIPTLGESVSNLSGEWYPRVQWTDAERQMTPLERIYGQAAGSYFITAGAIHLTRAAKVTFTGTVSCDTVLWVAGVTRILQAGSFTQTISLSGGNHILAYYGRDVQAKMNTDCGAPLQCMSPVRIRTNLPVAWVYAGPFATMPDMEELLTMQVPFQTVKGVDYWRVDIPDTCLRPMNEGVLYGEWNYPLGVTLYGLMQSARLMNHEALKQYVGGHMEKCVGFYKYCMWDKSVYGAAPFHNQLTTVDSLDDCGSFASAMLEVMKDTTLPGGDEIGDMVADYMMNHQQRLEDGTFYRNHSYLKVMNETMWADDLYMSIPFLCRYYERTKDEAYLREAAFQMQKFYEYLYMPETQIMSHIYDTGYGLQTKVPWGRGNGWVIFSLSELLAVMPETDRERDKILAIFQNLSQGYGKLQGKDGMWHQVLTMEDSFEETSCTAMFIYGFARGVRYGWLETPEVYADASVKGWEALCKKAIDWKGNIYGVCRGSGYSFSKEYYAKDLGWNFNDNHGTGIVMLAGIEVEKMMKKERNLYEDRI